jgi:DNA-binding PadR family transcriptional regulator
MPLDQTFPDEYTMLVFEVLSERQPCYAVKLCDDKRLDRGTMKGVGESDYPLCHRSVMQALQHLEEKGLVEEHKRHFILSERGEELIQIVG